VKILVTISSDVETIENAIVANHDDDIKATKFVCYFKILVEKLNFFNVKHK